MAFNRNKIIFGLLGASIATGIAIVSSNNSNTNETNLKQPQDKQTINKTTLRTKYKTSLIDGEMNIWNNRFADLKKGNPKHKSLLLAKKASEEEGGLKTKEACQEIIDTDEGAEWFNDFRNFCVMKNKDEVRLITQVNGFDTKYSTFIKAKKESLSKGFASIWDQKGTAVNESWKTSMLKECQRLQEKMYENDAEDRDFSVYCVIP
ncbi:hypothetical protein A6V39_04235 [Candidatus Mycoplasma haematobovis]|uniref:Uncharacterized protein n=1 Tax=Candidatus Mycoplasma haematobovis TaxID=432608 RepID=A0A1A9QDR5_9MOLU|nr:hypothetical protein [Candidatus Mycoplasma haematobovis]OAL10095.1 hypothetical protein A6V39_04235 [Candidatus Mycoplasma haematobovis]